MTTKTAEASQGDREQPLVGAALLTRQQARDAFARSSVTLEEATDTNSLATLRRMINAAMVESGCIDGTLRCHQRPVPSLASIQCRSRYFDSREVVTFNADGFIGFAGWADDTNVQPILKGFLAWLDFMDV
jgi:hypothetical protein